MPKTTTKAGRPKASTKKPTGRKKKETKPIDEKTFYEFTEEATKQKKKHTKAGNTTTAYDGRVKQAQEWLAKFCTAVGKVEDARKAQIDALLEESQDVLDTLLDREDTSSESTHETLPDNFAASFDGPPSNSTPKAIAMFLYIKCFEEDKGKSTAWQIYSAMRRHYDDLDGDTYRGPWREDRDKKIWVGNPTNAALVQDMVKACKNKDGETERTHSKAMSFEDMVALYEWSCKMCPDNLPVTDMESLTLKTEHLSFRAFISIAFTLWTRNCETSSLRVKNVDRNPEPRLGATPLDPKCIVFRLFNRKGWQRESINSMRTLVWMDHLERQVYKRHLEPDDYLFPTIGAGGAVQAAVPVTADTVQKKVNEYAKLAGLPGAGKYTTHCFRCGGAQYRCMWAPPGERWPLTVIRWWGGWAPGEKHNTLMLYLLDELHTYETDYSDAMCPINLQKDSSFLREAAALAPLRADEARIMLSEAIGQITQVIHAHAHHHSFSQTSQTTMAGAPLHPVQPVSIHSAHPVPINSSIIVPPLSFNPAATGYQTYSTAPSQSTPIPDAEFSIRVPRITCGRDVAWEQVIKDWDQPDPTREHMYALKDWKQEWIDHPAFAMQYRDRRKIALEFVVRFGRDKARFCAAYPQYKKGITALKKAIHSKQLQENRVKSRCSKLRRASASARCAGGDNPSDSMSD
ncbi:hypothetical protein VNI00_014824 [Paramarasmius palmivorus]|uniref:Tyr recombinase domain-containing protein n=1 Tax=Paramarasmius palmivorus TaxID=297713 RepID=A0AAW0BQ66_9AGAR